MVFPAVQPIPAPHRAWKTLTLSPMYVGKVPKKEAEEKAMAQLKRVRIAEQVGKYPLQLRRSAAAGRHRARLCLTPKIMLFDGRRRRSTPR